MCIQSWKDKNPSLEYKLWTNDDLTPEHFLTYDLIQKARSYAQASDMMRYEILNRFGGIYVDTDFECLQSVEPLLELADAWDVGLVISHEEDSTRDYVS